MTDPIGPLHHVLLAGGQHAGGGTTSARHRADHSQLPVMSADLWVLGNLTIDDLVLPDGTTAMGLCGGNAIFAALGGRLWSTRVGLAARIGPDFPETHVRSLEAAGIQLALSPTTAPSMHNWALYETADRRRFINWLDSGSHVDQSLSPAEVPR